MPPNTSHRVYEIPHPECNLMRQLRNFAQAALDLAPTVPTHPAVSGSK